MLNAQMDLNVPLVIHFRLSAVLLSGLLCIGVTMLALLEPARQASKQSVTRVLQGGSYGITNTSKTRQVKHKTIGAVALWDVFWCRMGICHAQYV